MQHRDALRNVIFLAQVAGGWQFPNALMQYALPDLEPLSVDIPRLQRRPSQGEQRPSAAPASVRQ